VRGKKERHTDSLLGGSGSLLSGLNTSSKLLSDLHVQLDCQIYASDRVWERTSAAVSLTLSTTDFWATKEVCREAALG
jgi:hypothetical protein